jgi:hypothetical protein
MKKPKLTYEFCETRKDGAKVFRATVVPSGKYMPHQGKKECAKRVRPMVKGSTHILFVDSEGAE